MNREFLTYMMKEAEPTAPTAPTAPAAPAAPSFKVKGANKNPDGTWTMRVHTGDQKDYKVVTVPKGQDPLNFIKKTYNTPSAPKKSPQQLNQERANALKSKWEFQRKNDLSNIQLRYEMLRAKNPKVFDKRWRKVWGDDWRTTYQKEIYDKQRNQIKDPSKVSETVSKLIADRMNQVVKGTAMVPAYDPYLYGGGGRRPVWDPYQVEEAYKNREFMDPEFVKFFKGLHKNRPDVNNMEFKGDKSKEEQIRDALNAYYSPQFRKYIAGEGKWNQGIDLFLKGDESSEQLKRARMIENLSKVMARDPNMAKYMGLQHSPTFFEALSHDTGLTELFHGKGAPPSREIGADQGTIAKLSKTPWVKMTKEEREKTKSELISKYGPWAAGLIALLGGLGILGFGLLGGGGGQQQQRPVVINNNMGQGPEWWRGQNFSQYNYGKGRPSPGGRYA
jgi:hypothetical protein